MEYKIIVHESRLTEELRKRFDNLYEEVSNLDFNDRLNYHSEISALINDILNNKRLTFEQEIKKALKGDIPNGCFITFEDKETDECILKLFSLLSNRNRID